MVEQRLLIVVLKGQNIKQRSEHRWERLFAGLIDRLLGPKCSLRLRQKAVLILRQKLRSIRHGDVLLLHLCELLLHLRVEFLLGSLQRLRGFSYARFNTLAPGQSHTDREHVVVTVAATRLLKHITDVEIRLALTLRRLELSILLVNIQASWGMPLSIA